MQISRDQFRLSFPKGPQFHTTTSRKTGKKIVTCTLAGVILQPEMSDGNVFNTFSWWNGESTIVVTARAVCSDNDAFAEKIGQAVAAAKAESKAYAKVRKLIQERLNEGITLLQLAQSRFNKKADNVISHNVQYIARVTDPESDLYKRKTQTC